MRDMKPVYRRWESITDQSAGEAQNTIMDLLAEIDRVQAEVERLRANNKSQFEALEKAILERERLRAEVEKKDKDIGECLAICHTAGVAIGKKDILIDRLAELLRDIAGGGNCNDDSCHAASTANIALEWIARAGDAHDGA